MAPNRPSQIPLPGRSSPPPVDAQEPTTPRPTAPSASSGSYPFAPPTQSLFTKRRESQSELEAPVAIKIDIPGPPRLLAREFAKSIANSSTSTPQPSNASSKGNLAADGGLLPATMTTALNAAAASNSSGRMARSSTITKNSSGGSNSSAKRSGSKQPPIRKDSEAGYEGGMERHGQANDFVDEPEDEDSHDESTPPSANTSAKHTRNDSPPVSATSMKSSASSNNGGAKFPDLSDSYHRNRNPSASAHHHPSKLPLHSRRTQNPRDLYKTKGRTASVSSTRSTEAQMHPFPTPGMNNDPAGKEDGLFDEWKSVEETRLDEDERKEKHWKRWGPYVSERQWVSHSFCPWSYSADDTRIRPPSEKITLRMETPGLTSLTSTLDRERTDGEKMDSVGSPTIMERCVSRSDYGTVSIRFSRRGCLVSLVIKVGHFTIVQMAVRGIDVVNRKSRRRCQGALLLPRLYAYALVHEVPLQVSSARIPVRRARSRKQQPKSRRGRIRDHRYRRLR